MRSGVLAAVGLLVAAVASAQDSGAPAPNSINTRNEAAFSPGMPTHTDGRDPKDTGPANIVLPSGQLDDTTRLRTQDDTIRDILMNRRPPH